MLMSKEGTIQQISPPATLERGTYKKFSISIPEDSYYGTTTSKYFIADGSTVTIGKTFIYETGDTIDQEIIFSELPEDTIINIVYCN